MFTNNVFIVLKKENYPNIYQQKNEEKALKTDQQ